MVILQLWEGIVYGFLPPNRTLLLIILCRGLPDGVWYSLSTVSMIICQDSTDPYPAFALCKEVPILLERVSIG